MILRSIKIDLTKNKLTVKLVKELKDAYYKNYLIPFPDKDFNNSPRGEESIFWLEEDRFPEVKNIVGNWHGGEGRVNKFSFNADGTCSAYGEALQRKGTWKVQDSLIVLDWSDLIEPIRIKEETGESYYAEGEYDTLRIMERDTMRILRFTNFRLITRDHGLFIGGSNKSIGY